MIRFADRALEAFVSTSQRDQRREEQSDDDADGKRQSNERPPMQFVLCAFLADAIPTSETLVARIA